MFISTMMYVIYKLKKEKKLKRYLFLFHDVTCIVDNIVQH